MRLPAVAWLAAALCIVAAAMIYAKVAWVGLPLKPDATSAVWTVEARASFYAQGNVKARLALPSNPPGFEVLDEDFVVRDFGLAEELDGGQRYALLSARRVAGPQALYYRLSVNPDDTPGSAREAFPGYPKVPDYPELFQPAIDTLLKDVRGRSADIASFARQLILRLNTSSDPAVQLLRDEATTPEARARQVVDILAGARIPARVVHGLELRHGVLEGRLKPWLEVHNEQQWLAFNPETGDMGRPENFLVWQVRPGRLLTVENGESADLRFSVRRAEPRAVDLARQLDSPLAKLSLLGLPLHVQNVYTVLLMVPFGALLVVLLRNVVGIRTFGTFMPVLIALAFRETGLLWGIVLFTVVVGFGLLIRAALEGLKLLLVPRLAAVLICVILIMALLSLLSHRLGLDTGLSVALFPMVILTMTIERLSVVWDERGADTALKQAGGSLIVATLCYLLMRVQVIEYWFFAFPELLLVLLALTLLLGRYTGYRLTEIKRFRVLAGEKT